MDSGFEGNFADRCALAELAVPSQAMGEMFFHEVRSSSAPLRPPREGRFCV